MALPAQFADLLSARGRRVLEGRVPALAGVLKTGKRFVTATGLLDVAKSRALLAALEEHVAPHLKRMEAPIPPESIWGVQRNYTELLPKTVRVSTVVKPSRFERTGVLRLLRSDSFKRFAEVLSGRRVRSNWGTQVLAYGPGDYAGPHHDHHPEEPLARDGYTDVHLTFCTRGVASQLLVYAPYAHFSEQADVATLGGVTAYRLPFWHYTTPLMGGPSARRWVLLGTFLDR
jgi:hypothetical protein